MKVTKTKMRWLIPRNNLDELLKEWEKILPLPPTYVEYENKISKTIESKKDINDFEKQIKIEKGFLITAIVEKYHNQTLKEKVIDELCALLDEKKKGELQKLKDVHTNACAQAWLVDTILSHADFRKRISFKKFNNTIFINAIQRD